MENMSEVTISIVIPFYNVGDYMRKTIRSLESQTYKKFEVIFINDGSTDNSLEVLEDELSRTSFKYEIINKKNGGVSSARNIGIDLSNGEFVYFLDADDYLFEETLEKVVEMFTSEKCDIVFFKYRRVDENGEPVWHYNEMFKNPLKVEKGMEILKKYINIEVFIYNCSIVYSKKAIDDLYYNENRSMGEDQEFIIKALYGAKKVGFIDSELINYLVRAGSATNSIFTMKMLEPIDLFNSLYHEYKDENEELKIILSKRRSREVLWRIKEYIRKGVSSNAQDMENYIKTNILNKKHWSYLEGEHLKYLSYKNIIEIYFLKYFLGLSIRLIKIKVKSNIF